MEYPKDKVTLVTGATRGIGKAIALELAGHGAVVIGTATTQQGADSISGYLQSAGMKGCGMVLNVNDADSIELLMRETTSQYGDVEILVNNAGITRDNLLLRMKEQEWDDILETNLKSVYRLCKACLRGMTKARFGRIINITSIVGLTGNPGQSNYAAAKAGLIGFTKALAREVATRNITVNTIAPGFIKTDMTDNLSDKQQEQLMDQIPMKRLGSPEDVAAAVYYLASPMADYVTGTTLHVNGGMHMS